MQQMSSAAVNVEVVVDEATTGTGEVLRIDRVLSSQPEFGGAVPDGGYGWAILLGAAFFQLTVPSLLIAYGVFIMFSTLETSDHLSNFKLWDNAMVYTPVFFIALATISDPVCRIIIANSRWPRLVALCGTCLTCSGILLFWLATIHTHLLHKSIYIMAGIFSGFGASLVLTQTEILVAQYFRLKLSSVTIVLWVSGVAGFALTPVILGHYVNQYGLPHVIVWYHLYVLVGVIVCLIFKKPEYLKDWRFDATRNRCNSGDEEDIYPKNSTELKTARSSRHPSGTDENSPSTSSTTVTPKLEWERFSDEEDDDDDIPNEFHEDLDHNATPPRDLFTELHLNNNTTYSFDNANVVDANQDMNIFMPVLMPSDDNYRFFLAGSFYRNLLLLATIKFSTFAFYALYPSMLYFSITYLHKQSVSTILGYIFCSCLLLIAVIKWMKINRLNRLFFMTVLSWVGCVGFYMISDTTTLAGKIIGGIFAAATIVSQEHVSEPYLKLNKNKTEPNRMYLYLNLIGGVSLACLGLCNLNYVHLFRIMGMLQFVNGTVWFCNYVYNMIKK